MPAAGTGFGGNVSSEIHSLETCLKKVRRTSNWVQYVTRAGIRGSNIDGSRFILKSTSILSVTGDNQGAVACINVPSEPWGRYNRFSGGSLTELQYWTSVQCTSTMGPQRRDDEADALLHLQDASDWEVSYRQARLRFDSAAEHQSVCFRYSLYDREICQLACLLI